MLKRFLISWSVGTVSILLIGYALVLLLGLVAGIAERDSFALGLGPITFIEHTRDDSGTSLSAGGGIFYLALLGGLLNGLGAAYFGSRSRRDESEP